MATIDNAPVVVELAIIWFQLNCSTEVFDGLLVVLVVVMGNGTSGTHMRCGVVSKGYSGYSTDCSNIQGDWAYWQELQ